MATPSHISVTYAKELSNLQYGYPLWFPEGPHDDSEAVEPGDVGRIDQYGAFEFMFNFRPKYRGHNDRDMARIIPPSECHYFDLPNHEREIKHKTCFLEAGYHASRSVNVTDNGAEAGAGIQVADAECSFSIKSEFHQCALCYLPQHADRTWLQISTQVHEYVKSNIEKWHHHINIRLQGVKLKLEEVVVITGVVASPECFLAAVTSSSKSRSVGAQATFLSIAKLGGHIEFKTSTAVPVMTRNTLKRPERTDLTRKLDLFLSYYRMKRFIGFFKKLNASAGPHTLPDEDGAEGDAVVLVDEYGNDADAGWPLAYTPMDALFDYIAERCPEAESAVACDDHISALYLGEEIPQDVLASLREKNPRIVVDENHVASLDLQDIIRRERVYEIMGTTSPESMEREDDSGRTMSGLSHSPLTFGAGENKTRIDWPHEQFTYKAQAQSMAKSFAISSDGKLSAVGFDDSAILLWDMVRGQLITSLRGHDDGVYALAFSPDDKHLASGSSDTSVRIWTVRDDDGNPIEPDDSIELRGHDLDVTELTYSPDGTRLASGALDGTIKIWDTTQQHRLLFDLQNIVWPIVLTFSHDGSKLFSTMDNLLFVWSMTDGTKTATLRGHTQNVYAILMSHDGTRMATVSEDITTRVWDVNSGDELLTLREHSRGVWAVAFSPDDSEIATGSADGTVVICDSWTGQRKHALTVEDGEVYMLRYTSRGDFICCASSPNTIEAKHTVRLLDTRSGTVVAAYEGHNDRVNSVKFTPDDQYIVSVADDGAIRRFSVDDVLRLL